MTLQEFIKFQEKKDQERRERFVEYYLDSHKDSPDSFPMEMSNGAWILEFAEQS